MRLSASLVLAVIVLGACDGETVPVVDAAMPVDAGPSAVEEPASPNFEVCPEGYRSTGTPLRCEPYGEAGPSDCPLGQHHLPGNEGCTDVGRACPAGPYAEGLPTDRTIVYAAADASAVGEGTRADPVSLEFAMRRGTDIVIALAKGHYEGQPVVLLDGVSLIGACAAETTLRLPRTAAATQAVAVTGAGTELVDLTISADDFGLLVQGAGATVTMNGVVFSAWGGLAVAVTDGATVRGAGVSLRGPGGGDHAGFEVSDSIVELSEVTVENAADVGLTIYGAASSVTLTDFVIRGTTPFGPAPSGGAVGLEDGHLTLTRGAILGNAGTGILLSSNGRAVLEDVTVRGHGGTGISVWEGSTLGATRVVVSDGAIVGMYIRESTASLTDVIVENTRPVTEVGGGTGIIAFDAEVTGQRVFVVGNTTFGFVAHEAESDVTMDDLIVEHTEGYPDTGLHGRGLTVSGGAQMRLTRARISDSRDVGVIVALRGAALIAESLEVSRTVEQLCATSTCSCCGAGNGIDVLDGGTLQLNRFTVRDSALIGIQVLAGASLDLSNGDVTRAQFGFNLQGDTVDIGADVRNVVFQDITERNLVREMLSAPSLPDFSDVPR